ncbi:hypothetical protein CVT26_003148 [Gymnopilus dilepis]|uniref:Endo-1,6-alpha-mannosidase n=1 Tax=Gymnopilus dilepis TaxID=231916 RepID=A0A409W2P5_9AGAR|nr:hypothetical protein CVT26_003148 [Gymnopilus dilepis]
MLLEIVPLIALCAVAVAQSLSPDPNWRDPSTTRTKSERITIAQNAINTMLQQLDSSTAQFNGIGYWQAANAFSAMAIQDQLTKSTTNKAVVVQNLKLAFQLWKTYDQFGWWATAAFYAYQAYGDTQLLNNSIAVWNSVTPYVITQQQASAGRTPVKSFALAGSCDDATMAGGVFWRPTTDDTSINSITTGLSSYLAQTTQDSKYTNAAILSATWIKAHNINSNNIVLDTESGADCSRSPASWLFTYNSGKFIEGLSVLTTVTNDDQWNQLMLNVTAAAVKNTAWQGTNGIITEGSDNNANNDGIGFKAIFIRGLLQAYRKSSNQALLTLLRDYTDVQYNALLDLASNGTSYSASWPGPPPTAFTSWGQLAALDVLTAAVGVN